MKILSVLIDPILPVFAILALGYVMARTGRITPDTARGINRFAMTVAVPIVLFDLLGNAPLGDLDLAALLAYFAAQIVVFAVGFGISAHVLGRSPGEAVILAYGAIFANNVFFGLPIARLIYGEVGLLPVTGIVVVDSAVSFGGTMLVLQLIRLGRIAPREILGIFVRSPALLAILAGLAWGLAGPDIPKALQTFLDFNGVAAAPVALFALGAVMAEAPLWPDRSVVVLTLLKAFVFPAAVWLSVLVLAPGTPDPRLYVLGAAAPTGAMAMSLAVLYDLPARTIAQMMVWTTLVALFVMAGLA